MPSAIAYSSDLTIWFPRNRMISKNCPRVLSSSAIHSFPCPVKLTAIWDTLETIPLPYSQVFRPAIRSPPEALGPASRRSPVHSIWAAEQRFCSLIVPTLSYCYHFAQQRPNRHQGISYTINQKAKQFKWCSRKSSVHLSPHQMISESDYISMSWTSDLGDCWASPILHFPTDIHGFYSLASVAPLFSLSWASFVVHHHFSTVIWSWLIIVLALFHPTFVYLFTPTF